MPKRSNDLGRLPPHAIAEIKKDPSQRAYWDRWSAVGEAKDEEFLANQKLALVAEEWRNCREKGDFPDRPGPDCSCGKHQGMWEKARNARDSARAAVEAAINAFKAGDDKKAVKK